MNFKKINILLLALIILIFGAIFFIHKYNSRFEKKPPITAKPAPIKQVFLKEKITKLLEKLEKEQLIEVKDWEKLSFVKKGDYEEILRNGLAFIDSEIIMDKQKDKLIFKKGEDKLEISILTESKELPKLVIVIDDIGNSLELGERVLQIPNLTLSIIPDLRYSFYFAEKGKKLKRDILVHVPMEPKNTDKYGNDTKMLRVDMDDASIDELSDSFLKAVPYAIGANNHMGSKFTENDEKMRVFLKKLRDKKMFFLDSKTTSTSVGSKLAEELNIPNLTRDIFLDHDVDEQKISEQLDRAITEAKNKGFAIAIGHPHKETLDVLKKRFNEIEKSVKVVPISVIIKRQRG